MGVCVTVLVLLAIIASPASAQGIRPHLPLGQTTGVHYVSTAGVGSGGGTAAAPWSLTYAVSGAGGQLTAGETVWMRAGTYSGRFTIVAHGSAGSYVIFRAYPTERVVIESTSTTPGSADIVTVGLGGADATSGSYVRLWDLEIRNVATGSRAQSGGTYNRGYCVAVLAPFVSIVNSVLHDCRDGIGTGGALNDGGESYGNLIYYNGSYDTDDPAQDVGMGIYSQTIAAPTAYKYYIDNLVFNNYNYGGQIYGSSDSYARSVWVEGSAWFATAMISNQGNGTGRNNLFIGVNAAQCNQIRWLNNSHYSAYGVGGASRIGYGGYDCTNMEEHGDYIFARASSGTNISHSGAQKSGNSNLSGNTFGGRWDTGDDTTWPTNTWVATDSGYPTSGNRVVLRPNVYEPGRAHVIVYNWTLASSVTVDLASANFTSGDTYAIYDAQDYFGTAVASGTYTGSAVSIPMTNTSVSTPYGTVGTPPTNTAPQFGAFVVKKTSS